MFDEGQMIRKCLANKLGLAIRALTCGDDPRSDETLSASGHRAMDLRILLISNISSDHEVCKPLHL